MFFYLHWFHLKSTFIDVIYDLILFPGQLSAEFINVIQCKSGKKAVLFLSNSYWNNLFLPFALYHCSFFFSQLIVVLIAFSFQLSRLKVICILLWTELHFFLWMLIPHSLLSIRLCRLNVLMGNIPFRHPLQSPRLCSAQIWSATSFWYIRIQIICK